MISFPVSSISNYTIVNGTCKDHTIYAVREPIQRCAELCDANEHCRAFVYDSHVWCLLKRQACRQVLPSQSQRLYVRKINESRYICVRRDDLVESPKRKSCRAQWLRARVSDSRLRKPGFESCAAVLKHWARFLTRHCHSSLSCINVCLAIDSGGYVYEQPSRINCSIWLDASQRN